MGMLLLVVALFQVATPTAGADARLYVVGPNDVLAITVYNQPQLTGKFAVEADGTIAFPLLGRVSAGGLSVRAVEDKLREALGAGFLANPQVSVAVEQYRSQQIFVMGEVRQPGTLEFKGAMTLIEALSRAGSTTDHAGAEAVIVRGGNGSASGPAPSPTASSSETVRVNLLNLQRGALAQNVALHPGDTVFVPKAETVFVSGQVKAPGEYVLRPGMTVRQALALAGGVSERGSTRRIQIIRTVDDKEVTLDVDLQKLLQAGDTIVVRERFF
jgi:polysaccharide export outer membrane protein